MQPQDTPTLDQWVSLLGKTEIPVLRKTSVQLAALHENEQDLGARKVAQVILRDPLMTVKLLRHLQLHKHRRQEHEVAEVEQALLMIGVEGFFRQLPARPLVEDILSSETKALVHLLQTLHCAQQASSYAFDWAVRLRDLHYEEVSIAALLHDLPEILMWCFAPAQMLEIHNRQHQDKSLPSRSVQQAVLGFTLIDLQHALAVAWKLPELLLTLMDDAHAGTKRVKNVVLAVNLARHAANGWNDAALPDDFRDIGDLLGMPAQEVKEMVLPTK